MLIKKKHALEKKNSDQCVVWEYPFDISELNFATGLIDGRYPDNGFVLNEKCDELIFVISGQGTVYYENKLYDLNQEDSFLIKKQKKYYIEGKNLFCVILTWPPFDPKQHKFVS